LLAYVEMLARDAGRFSDARERFNVCPLGSGAIAGSTLPLDREFVARELGFVDADGHPRLTQNSMDAVSDRDFIVEFCAAAALASVHLSRLAEDVILWVSSEFNFVRLSDAYTTGSSLMPQKKNPDVAELTRGKTGRVVGNLTALLVLLKGLPMTYNRDLQEDKERLFDSAATLRSCLRLMAGMLEQAEVRADVCARAASDSLLLATDLADHLVVHGIPFREAHHLVGAVVAYAESAGKSLDQLSMDDYQKVSPRFPASSPTVFDLRQAMTRRNLIGAPGTEQVQRQLSVWKARLSSVSRGTDPKG
jgi:argininosuccinate lyase